MSSLVRTLEKRGMKRAGMRRTRVAVDFDKLLGTPIFALRIVDRDGAIVGVRWPRPADRRQPVTAR